MDVFFACLVLDAHLSLRRRKGGEKFDSISTREDLLCERIAYGEDFILSIYICIRKAMMSRKKVVIGMNEKKRVLSLWFFNEKIKKMKRSAIFFLIIPTLDFPLLLAVIAFVTDFLLSSRDRFLEIQRADG